MKASDAAGTSRSPLFARQGCLKSAQILQTRRWITGDGLTDLGLQLELTAVPAQSLECQKIIYQQFCRDRSSLRISITTFIYQLLGHADCSMLRRAALPLLRPRQCRPLIRETFAQTQLRYYRRDQGLRSADYKVPSTARNAQDELSSQSADSREPLRKVAFTRANPKPKDEQPSTSTPFGADPTRDINDISDSVSQATRTSVRDPEDVQTAGQNEAIKPSESTHQPQQPLPDLTRGIPSTLDAELNQARAKQSSHAKPSSLNITEDPAEEVPSGGQGRGGDDTPRTEYVSSSDRKKNMVFRYMYIIMGVGIAGYTVYLGRNWESEEEEKAHSDAPNGWGFKPFYNRVAARLGSTMSYYRDPVTTKLLPDEDPDPNLRYPFTLVISLEDMLIHSEWTREKGWRIAKRPGVDYFLRYLGSYYEIVLFTSQPMAMAEQVLRKLDPYQTIRWPLFREATLYKDGGYIKVGANDPPDIGPC